MPAAANPRVGGSGTRLAAPAQSTRDRRRILVAQLIDNGACHGSPAVQVEVSVTGGDVLIEVLDHGQGVREEFVPQLFDRFTRDSPNDERGLGLGLAIVHELATLLGGRVGYRRDDDGTVFWLRLPQAAVAT